MKAIFLVFSLILASSSANKFKKAPIVLLHTYAHSSSHQQTAVTSHQTLHLTVVDRLLCQAPG